MDGCLLSRTTRLLCLLANFAEWFFWLVKSKHLSGLTWNAKLHKFSLQHHVWVRTLF